MAKKVPIIRLKPKDIKIIKHPDGRQDVILSIPMAELILKIKEENMEKKE